MTRTTTTTVDDNSADPFDAVLTGLGHAMVWTVYAAALVVKWAILFPVISVPLGLAVLAGVLLGWPVGIGLGLAFAAGIMGWRHRRPEMFARWVTDRARARFLTWWRYTRRWRRLLTACHLTITEGDRVFCPRLLAVTVGEATDAVRVRMLAGHSPTDWENRAEHLAHAFGAQQCRVQITGPALVELSFRFSDTLAETVALPTHRHIPGGLGSIDKDAA